MSLAQNEVVQDMLIMLTPPRFQGINLPVYHDLALAAKVATQIRGASTTFVVPCLYVDLTLPQLH